MLEHLYRVLKQYTQTYFRVRPLAVSRGGDVFGSLKLLESIVSIGILCSEWEKWFLALYFIPFIPA